MKKLLIFFSFFVVFIGEYASANCFLTLNDEEKWTYCVHIDKSWENSYRVYPEALNEWTPYMKLACHIAWTRDNSWKAWWKLLEWCEWNFTWDWEWQHRISILFMKYDEEQIEERKSSQPKWKSITSTVDYMYDYDEWKRISGINSVFDSLENTPSNIENVAILWLKTGGWIYSEEGDTYIDNDALIENNFFVVIDSDAFRNIYNKFWLEVIKEFNPEMFNESWKPNDYYDANIYIRKDWTLTKKFAATINRWENMNYVKFNKESYYLSFNDYDFYDQIPEWDNVSIIVWLSLKDTWNEIFSAPYQIKKINNSNIIYYSEENWCSWITEIPESECEALVDFYHKLWWENRWKRLRDDDFPWSIDDYTYDYNLDPRLKEWKICYNDTVTGWRWVKCENWHIVEINLTWLRWVTWVIPESIKDLPYLRFLALADNHVTWIWESLDDLPRLHNLYLQHNDIEDVSDSLCWITNLEFIDLLQNPIKALPECIWNLKNVYRIMTTETQLSKLPDWICEIPSLEVIEVTNYDKENSYISTLPECLQDLPIRSIKMYWQNFSEIPDFIWNIQSLEEINFERNKITDIDEEIGDLYRLKFINFDDNKLQIIPNSLEDIHKNIYKKITKDYYRETYPWKLSFQRNNIFDTDSLRILSEIWARYNDQYQLKDLNWEINVDGTLELNPNDDGSGDRDFSDWVDFETDGKIDIHHPDKDKNDWIHIDFGWGFWIWTDHWKWNWKIMPPMDNNWKWKGHLWENWLPPEHDWNHHNTIVWDKVAGSEIDGLQAKNWYFHMHIRVPLAKIWSEIKLYRSSLWWEWALNTPDSTCVVDLLHMCYFRTDHLSYFSAIEEGWEEWQTYTVKFVDENWTELRSEELEYWTIPEYKWAELKKDWYTYSRNPEISVVAWNTTYTLQRTANTNNWWWNWGSGWSGWWGWGSSSSKDTTKTNTWATVNTWTTTTWTESSGIKTIENKESGNKINGGEKDNSRYEEWNQSEMLSNWYSREFNNAYIFAYKNWITTMDDISKADMNGPLTRIAMAKMLSNYAINILWKTPDTSKNISFPDVDEKLNSDYNNWVILAYQLWIMWIWIEKFRPYDEVSRAEFGTALSRMLFGLTDWTDNYYSTHLSKLKSEWIISNDNPELKELRWYVMLMLMRSAM